jgi:hypothetical protein
MNGDVLTYDAVLGELRMSDLPPVASITNVGCTESLPLQTTYIRFSSFIFEGSSTVGIPTQISVVVSASNSENTYNIRVQDITNQTTIASISNLDYTVETIVDLESIGNFTTTRAIWEVQASMEVGTQINLFINSMSILFQN